MGHGVCGAAQAHAVLTAGRCLGGIRQARQDEGQRAGPEGVDQLLGKYGHFLGVARDGVAVCHMHDQRMVGGAAFGREDLGYGGIVVAVRGQAIDGFGGQAQQLAALQGGCCGLYRCLKLSIQHHLDVLCVSMARQCRRPCLSV